MAQAYRNSPRPLRLAAIGCGAVFQRLHLPAIRAVPEWELVAACDPLPQRREWLAQSCPGVRTVESLMQLLDSVPLDAILITAPPGSHCSLAMQALAAGLHVLVEKPMATTPSEAIMMVEAARQDNKHLWVGFTRRFRRPYLQLRKSLQGLSVGAVEGAEFRLTFDPKAWAAVTQYLGQEHEGGGVLEDVASHQLDLLPWLFGQPGIAIKVSSLERSTAYGCRCAFQLKLANGIIVDCVASHAEKYEEELSIRLQDRFVFSYPYGYLEMRAMPRPWIRHYCRLKTLSHLAIHKLNGTPTVTLESFILQWKAFASTLHGEPTEFEAPVGVSGLWCQQALHACHESLNNGRTWISVG